MHITKEKIAILLAMLTIFVISGCTTTARYYHTTAVYYSNTLPNDFNDNYPLPYTAYPTSYYSSTTVTSGYCCHHYHPYYNDGLIVQRYYYDW